MTASEWRELSQLAWKAAKTDTARKRDWVGMLYRLHMECQEEALNIDALEGMLSSAVTASAGATNGD